MQILSLSCIEFELDPVVLISKNPKTLLIAFKNNFLTLFNFRNCGNHVGFCSHFVYIPKSGDCKNFNPDFYVKKKKKKYH